MSGLVVLVTGAARGVGAALAEALAARGETVFAGILDGHEPAGTSGVGIDVSDEAGVAAAAAHVAGLTRHLDIVMNVAGILGRTDTTMADTPDTADMHRVYDVNALGPLRIAAAFLPLLMGGRTRIIVNISSEAGSVAGCTRDASYGYCMSKAALNMASALMHNTLRPLGGCVVVVHPGWVRTWMRGHLDETADLPPADSAAGILAQVDKVARGDAAFRQERPAFIDWRGDPMPW